MWPDSLLYPCGNRSSDRHFGPAICCQPSTSHNSNRREMSLCKYNSRPSRQHQLTKIHTEAKFVISRIACQFLFSFFSLPSISTYFSSDAVIRCSKSCLKRRDVKLNRMAMMLKSPKKISCTATPISAIILPWLVWCLASGAERSTPVILTAPQVWRRSATVG